MLPPPIRVKSSWNKFQVTSSGRFGTAMTATDVQEWDMRRRGFLHAVVGLCLGAAQRLSAGAAPAPATDRLLELTEGEERRGQIVVREGESLLIRGSANCVLEHVTSEPYQPVIRVLPGAKLVIEGGGGLTVRHSSPSVASNFAIEVGLGAKLVLRNTTVTSSTGSGVCVQGGSCEIERCKILDCAEHGVAVYDDIETGEGSEVSVRDTVISGVRGYGIQARGQDVRVDVAAAGCTIQGRKGMYNGVINES